MLAELLLENHGIQLKPTKKPNPISLSQLQDSRRDRTGMLLRSRFADLLLPGPAVLPLPRDQS